MDKMHNCLLPLFLSENIYDALCFKLITLYSILSAFGSKSDVEAGGTSKFQARGWAVGALSCFFWSRVLTV
jgi:hypothetical protein